MQQGVAPHNHEEERGISSRAEGREEQPWILATGNDGRGAALGRKAALEMCFGEAALERTSREKAKLTSNPNEHPMTQIFLTNSSNTRCPKHAYG
jgi:hypothetical protein